MKKLIQFGFRTVYTASALILVAWVFAILSVVFTSNQINPNFFWKGSLAIPIFFACWFVNKKKI
tara:strand:- start:6152 stop:6343 length:192 start_codon:yes stop_codon:yes gene_type:complete